MKKRVFLMVFVFVALLGMAQPPANYYDSADGLTGENLRLALHEIIKGHNSIEYNDIWGAFWDTDNKGNDIVWDMYSDVPDGEPSYVYSLGTDQCGNYSGEGCCYNREHSWPQSWFNKNNKIPRTDLHHIFATDGQVNHDRDNYPFGEVNSASSIFSNGSKLGSCKTPGYTGTVFEPIDEYKGDFARAIMYMSVRYYQEDSNWNSSPMTEKSDIKPWAIAMLLRWNESDPVSQKEIARNNVIYDDYQRNRNPFVDCPEYARMIWDPNWTGVNHSMNNCVSVYPNPVKSTVTIQAIGMRHVSVFSVTGQLVLETDVDGDETALDLSQLSAGLYLVRVTTERGIGTKRISVVK